MEVNASADDPYVRERILHLALEISAAESLNQILVLVLSRIDELVSFDLASIYLVDETDEQLVHKEINYRTPGYGGTRSDRGRRIPIDESNALGWVVQTGRPHLRRSLGEPFPFERVQRENEVVSHILVPIIGHQKILGVLAVGRFEEDAFDEVDMAIASQYARLTGLAIDNRRTYEQVSELALKDGLTGAYNHRHFQDVLARELHRVERYGEALSLMLLDVDDFKQFNDDYGHPAGDQVLKQTASILENRLRGSDMVFRYGGEEFAVLLPGTAPDKAMVAAGKLIEAMRGDNRYRNPDGDPVPVTASIGVSGVVGQPIPRETLIGRADEALYEAKHQGKDRAILQGDAQVPPK